MAQSPNDLFRAICQNAVSEITLWILKNGRHCPDIASFVSDFAECLLRHAIPVWHIYLGVRRLHPAFRGRAFVWRLDTRTTTVKLRRHGIEATPYYLDHPIAEIFSTGTTIRRCLRDDLTADDYPVLHKLKSEGGTDYLALPLDFPANAYQAISFTSCRRDGFNQNDIAILEDVLPALSAVTELLNERDDTRHVLATYVGERAGGRILGGAIQRNACGTVNSVLWLCDMEGFTEVAEVLSPEELLELLDDYFDAVVTPIEAAGGEVLKFMGDAVLAIFELASEADHEAKCIEACRAALTATAAVNRLSAKWQEKIGHPVSFGIALHIGPVSYGNVGSASRLDFTAIGPAVNLVSRIERLTRVVKQAIVLSEDFVKHLNRPVVKLGSFQLKGISRPQMVYGLREPLPDHLPGWHAPEIFDS